MIRHGRGDIDSHNLGTTRARDSQANEEKAALRAVLLRTTRAVPAKKRLTKKQAHQVLDMLGLLPDSAA